MGCEHCDAFDTEVEIPSLGVLHRVAKKIQNAVLDGTLSVDSPESNPKFTAQPSFMDLDLSGLLPDILQYHFNCQKCGSRYSLAVETYHGAGGKWFPSGASFPGNSEAEEV